MEEYYLANFDGMAIEEIEDVHDDKAFKKVFDTFKDKTHKTEEEAWDEIIH